MSMAKFRAKWNQSLNSDAKMEEINFRMAIFSYTREKR